MFGWLFSLIKWSFFAGAVLVLGQIVEWRDRSISDHIKTTLSHFDSPKSLNVIPSFPTVKNRISESAQKASKRVEQFSKEERARLEQLLSKQAQ